MSWIRCAVCIMVAVIPISSAPSPCRGWKMLPWLSVLQVTPLFRAAHFVGQVTSPEVVEASGLGASRRHPGVLYTLNDSGNRPVVYAIDSRNGNLLARLTIDNATNVDWEDIAVGPCDASRENGYCIYIGDTGRNKSPIPADRLYRVREPAVMTDSTLDIDAILDYIWDIPDCESVMVDPTGEVYLISKVTGGGGSATHVPREGWGLGSKVTITGQVQLQIHSVKAGPIAGDISPDGQEILVKTRYNAYYWKLASGESYIQALTRDPVEVPHAADEAHGESICWTTSADGYYTLSEGDRQPLYFFKRM